MSQMKKIASLLDEIERNNRHIIEITERNTMIKSEIQALLSPTEKEGKKPKPAPKPTFTKEEVRAVLAKLAANGHKVEVKQLLQAYGASSLSTLDEKHYGAVIEEAGGIGHV